jgi:hypothetical protein
MDGSPESGATQWNKRAVTVPDGAAYPSAYADTTIMVVCPILTLSLFLSRWDW